MKLYSLLTGELAGGGSGAFADGKRIASPFWRFIFVNQINRKYFVIALTGSISQFIIFKLLYPFPDFISDSYSYIATNLYHMDVNLWPIGYSKFLLLVHMISHSDTFLVAVQYFLLEATLVYFFYTILYLFQPGKIAKITIFIFLFFNPLFLYLSNSILSDAIFTALSIGFLSQFLWMFYRPNIKQIIIQGLIIGVAFTIRYTAMYYPLIAIAGLILSNQSIKMKVLGSILGIAFMYPFYLYTKSKTKEITGTAEFSVFGGWQIANNALYMYDHIKVDSNKLPEQTRDLDRLSRQFFKSARPTESDLSIMPGTYFIKVPSAILKPYMLARYTFDDPISHFRAWGKVSPIYNNYGTYLISHHPFAFFRYYLLLNLRNYFLPHLEKFGTYNIMIDYVPGEVEDWFGYVTPEVHSISKTFQGKLFYLYPSLFLVLNVFFLGHLIWLFARRQRRKMSRQFLLSLSLVSIFLIINGAFSVLATPVVLRYQVIPMILLVSFLTLMIEFPKNLFNTNEEAK